MAIVFIGTAFFTGISAISNVMSRSVNEYNDKLNLKDITVYSNYGFDSDDVKAINDMDSVELAEGTKFVDVYATENERTRITRIHSYNENDEINHFVLREGRLPENEHEALADHGTVLLPGFSLGETVTFKRPDDDLEDNLNVSSVTVVGIIDTPLYLNVVKGPSTLSNQELDTYLYVPEKAFSTDYFSEVNVLIKDGKTYDEFSKEYEDYSASIKQEVKDLALMQAGKRRQKLQDEAMDEWNEGYEEYEDGLKEYEDGQKKYEDGLKEYQDGWNTFRNEMSKAEKQLLDARNQINDGWTQLAEGEQKLRDAQAELDQARIDYTKQIEDGKAQLADGYHQLEEGKKEFEKVKSQYTKQIEDAKAQLAEGYRQLEEGKKEFAEKEAEYLAIRSQLAEALNQLNQPMLDGNIRLNDYMGYLPCDEARCLVRALLRYGGFDPDTVTIGEITDFINDSFNAGTIAAMNARIDEVLSSQEFTEILIEDGEVDEDIIELLKERSAEDEEELLEEDEEKRLKKNEDSEEENDADITDEDSESELNAADELIQENPDMPSEGNRVNNNVPSVPPVPVQPPITVPEEPQISSPEPENTQPPMDTETVSNPEEAPQVVEDTEVPAETILEETPPEPPAVPDGEIQPEEMTFDFSTPSIAQYLGDEKHVKASNLIKVTKKAGSIECFSDLIDAMGDSDPTFTKLMKITIWPYMPVDTGIRILNTKAELLAAAGQIIQTFETTAISDEITLGTIIPLYPELAQLRDELGLSDNNTLGDVRSVLVQRISEIDSGLAEGRRQIAENEALLAEKSRELAAGEAELNSKLAEGWKEIADGEALLAEKSRELEEGEAELNRKLTEGQQQINDGWAEIEENRQKLYDAEKELKDGYATYLRERQNGLTKLANAQTELDEAKAELDKGAVELEDAKAELDDALEEIQGMEAAEWTVLDRSQHYASATYKQTIQQMSAIARIFPAFFIAVAALVCLTTMTRLVNEERGQIGILRALGYNGKQCSFTYLYYAGLAALLGTAFGSLIGMIVFPTIIYDTWKLLYILPAISYEVPWGIILLTALVFFLMMEGVTAYVLYEDMNEAPAAVLRPKPPKLGKSILLEKMTLIWNHLTFSWKVTVRNIVRYKQRVLMTVLGVAGCTALLVTGFGISDSINGFMNTQFNTIDHFNASAELAKDYRNPESRAKVIEKLKQINGTEAVFSALGYSGKVHNVNEKEEVAYMRIFQDSAAMQEAFELRERVGHHSIEPEEGSVIISEKMSENLGIHVGDLIEVESFDGDKAMVPVSGIMEIYVFHYVLMTDDTYKGLFGTVPEYNTLLLQSDEEHSSDEAYHAAVASVKGVENVEFNSSVIDNFSNMIKGINGVVLVLIVSSMALAFVVLGNLTNVNISERLREIATLKVLGFRQREVQNYIYKENNILVGIGAIFGLPMGDILSKYIMHEVELSNVMFGRQADVSTFVYSFLLTILFGLLVNFFMRNKLNNILMVESLKSVE